MLCLLTCWLSAAWLAVHESELMFGSKMHSGLTMSEEKIVNGVDDDGSVKDETNLHL